MRIKLGIDPTARDLHLGHTVPLRKLSQYQEEGHIAVLIIGDFTALIGDPSGRSDLRPMLTREQIKDNEVNYLEAAGKILDMQKTEVHHNSEWFADKGMDFAMDLMRRVTVAQVLEREDFQDRMKGGTDVALLELLYPLLQGYDSVAIKADIEIGGTDQTFNLHMGRRIQRSFGVREQEIATFPLLIGLDGKHKMSKSLGNYIAISDSAQEMFGKVMSIPDATMPQYYELLTDVKIDLAMPPKSAKENLAKIIVEQYHSKAAAETAQAEFANVFSKGGVPSVMTEGAVVDDLAGTMAAHFKISKSEAHRKIHEGAVSINGKTVSDITENVKPGDILRAGRKFLKVI